MATTIKGIVFNDLNHNGKLDPGEPGIPNVFVTLFRVVNGKCEQTMTDANGAYSFTVHPGGTYKIFETVANANACPPSLFTQPAGFFFSNGPRELTVEVENGEGDEDNIIGDQNFSHDATSNPLVCTDTLVQFVNTPTEWFDIDVVTGNSSFEGLLNPADDVNAIGYNVLDNYIYGYDQTTHHIVRIDSGRNVTQLLPNPTGLPSVGFNVGSFDLAGHLFLMVNDTARFYTVDLNSNSPTFMKLVDPTNGFVEQTSNFGTALSATLNVSDWGLSPIDGFLYGVRSVGSTGQVMRVNPTTGAVTALTTTMPNLNPTGRSWGAVAVDAEGVLFAIYNGDGGVFRFTISGNTALGTRISTTFETSFNDAAMCPTAAVGPISDVGVVKTASPNPVAIGEILTYTISVTNGGPDSANNVTLSDSVPGSILSPEYSVDGSPFLPWPGVINLGTLAFGGSRTVTIRGTVSASAPSVIVNTAVVSSSSADPNPNNNTSTISTDIIGGTCDARCQAITDLIESVALQETALAHILNAEGEKLQAIIGMEGVSAITLLEADASVQSLAEAVSLLEGILVGKLSLFDDCLCNNT